MIKASGLCKQFGSQVIFDDTGFALNSGERVGFVGRNGHGKSTLFKMILGEVEPDAGVITIPKYYKIGHLSQHLRFDHKTVLAEACSALPHSEDGIDETYKAKVILIGLGLTEDYFEMSPDKLSGGFQVRLNLAKVLVSEPALLLLDEPTNYLDIVSIRWLERFLQNWRGELMLITHDRTFMDAVTTHTMAVHRMKLRKLEGDSHKLYERIAEDEEIHEKTRVNLDKKRAETEEFINRFRAKASKAAAVQSRIKLLEKQGSLDELSNIKTLEFSFNAAPFQGKYPLEIKDLAFGYTADNPLIKGLSIAVNKNDRIGIIGKNGKGKSTLLNLIAGNLTPQQGEIALHPGLKTGYFGQTNIDRLDPGKTVEQELMETHHECTRAIARRIAGRMMFEKDNALKKVAVLSGGERSRVMLGKLLVTPSNMLMLDEPTHHLDMYSIDSLMEAVADFNGAVMIVTHSEMILRGIANRLIIFDNNKVDVFEGTYDEFLSRVGWQSEIEEGVSTVKAQKANASADNGNGDKNKGGNRKEQRRQRAEAQKQRAEQLKPIKNRIQSIEDAIEKLEEEQKAISAALNTASEKGDSSRIAELSMNFHECKEKIDLLFSELQELTDEHDRKKGDLEAMAQ